MNLLSKIFIVSLLCVSCSKKVAFTSSVKTNCGLSEDQLRHVQFYTSGEITLYKAKEQSDTKIRSGKIVVSEKKDAETIIIPKNTPCVLVKEMKDKFLLSFEYGDGKLLAFGMVSGGNYSLMAESWEDKTGKLQYGYRTYKTNNGDVYLKVNMKKLNRLKSKYRVVAGRTI